MRFFQAVIVLVFQLNSLLSVSQENSIVKYDFPSSGTYRKILQDEGSSNHYLIGQDEDEFGLIQLLDSDLKLIWHKEYTLQDANRIYFNDMIFCDNGDLLILGSAVIIAENNQHNLVLRVNKEGEVIWSKTYFQTETRLCRKIIKSVNDTYFFTSLSLPGNVGIKDDIEISKIDGEGNVLQSKLMGNNLDDQVFDIISYNNGVIIVGSSNSGSVGNWEGFFVEFDEELNIIRKKLIGTNNIGLTNYESIKHIIQTGPDSFILAGSFGPYAGNSIDNPQKSFILNFNPTENSHNVSIFDFLANENEFIKDIKLQNQYYYLTGIPPFDSPFAKSFIAKIKVDNFELEYAKEIVQPKDHHLSSMFNTQTFKDSIIFSGRILVDTDITHPYIFATNTNTDNCYLSDLSTIPQKAIWSSTDWNTNFIDANLISENVNLNVEDLLLEDDLFLELELGQDTAICTINSLSLNAGSCFDTYRWQDGSSGSTFTVTEAGTYSVEVSSLCGTLTDTITIENIESPILDLGNDTQLCEGETLTLNAGNEFDTYRWQDGSTASTFTVTSTGTYSVEVTTPCGTLTDFINIESIESRSINLGNDTLLCQGESLTLNAGNGFDTYKWQDGSKAPTLIVSEAGIYSIEVTSLCEILTDTIVVDSIDLSEIILPNAFSPNGDQYNESFELDNLLLGSALRVFNRWGKLVYKSNNYQNDWNGSGLISGTYFYIIDNFCSNEPLKGVINIVR